MLDIGIKRHACLIMLHSAIDALVEHRQGQGFDLRAVHRVVIHVSESVAKRTSWKLEPPGTPLGSQMNLRYAAAVALLDGAAYVEQFTPESLARPEVWELMDRIEVRHSPEIDALGRDRRFLTHIEVHAPGGAVVRLTGRPPQDHPFRGEDVVHKFRGLLDRIMEPERVRAIERFVLESGAGAQVGDLAQLLRDEVRPALSGV